MNDYTGLIERLEAESAPMAARGLACEMFRLFEPDFVAHLRISQRDFLPIRPNDVESIRTPDAYVDAHAPHYTTDLDEAFDLVRKHLPAIESCVDQTDTEVTVRRGDWGAQATLNRDTFGGEHTFSGFAATPALAVCAAAVKAYSALLSRERRDEERS